VPLRRAVPFPRVFELLAHNLARSGRARSPHSLQLNYLNYCVIISRALISSPQGGYMVHAARAATASAPAPLSSRHFLIGVDAIKNARNSPENNALNFSNRPAIACLHAPFSHVPRSKHHHSPVKHCASRFTNHQSLVDNRATLIATQILNLDLTPSQQTRKHFLIGTKFDISAPARHGKNPQDIFLIATHPNSENWQSHENKREKIF
jgi:hypothetical protein